MKRLAALLRHRASWQLVLIAALCVGLALLIGYRAYASTLRQLRPVLMLLYGVGGAALVLAPVRRAEELRGKAGAARGWAALALWIVGAGGLLAFLTYSFGHHATHMVAGFNAARLPDTLPERQAALAAAEAELRSPFALLPALLDDAAARECDESRRDLARVDDGKCTRWPIDGLACACGDERFPYPRCPRPNCLYAPGKPDRFDCPGDPVPQGYH